MLPRPPHLAPIYAAQFQDASVAAVYRKRPPYPETTLDILIGLLPQRRALVLDLGCGTGEIAIPLSRHVAHIDAVDRSSAMLDVARSIAGSACRNVSWLNDTAEQYHYGIPYDLVVAGASLHWMDWEVVLRKIRRSLNPNGFVAIVDKTAFMEAPWREKVLRIIPKYSTNREYQRFDFVDELCARRLFRVVGRQTTPPEDFEQSVEDYVSSFHSRNGFSRDRMSEENARQFDAEVSSLVRPFADDGMLRTVVRATATWGVPLAT